MSSKEAEAVKLFSNTFLAIESPFFNELDSFSEVNNINAEKVINGVCNDPRMEIFIIIRHLDTVVIAYLKTHNNY